jgi:LacI family transcriptional regulator
MIRKKVTIYDVANEAGVSRQTVSRVLNNRPDVARETRERVLGVIQRLGYRPSQLARSLSQGTSCTLGVVGYGIEYYGPSRTLSVIEKQANDHGYSLTLTLTHEPEDIDVISILNDLIAQHVDGIIWAVPQIGDIQERFLDSISNIATPIVCSNMLPHTKYSLVDSDNFEGGLLATRHLIERGNQRIGIITGPSNWLASKQRFEGWKAALNEISIPVDEKLIVEGDWSAASGYFGLSQLVEINPNIDAVFVFNDQMALGVLRAATTVGKRVPEDLALVGYDSIPESEYFSSSLTTVRQNFSEQGRIMVEEIERRIRRRQNGEADNPKTEFMKPELIIRDSSVRKGE